ncbi:MAG TPA: ABC transporter ATP-binding protein, partial [Opitutaceae bacterium]|nr:ABC transporter ATP-binding protein [Opitutaceae bacterium]
IGALVVLGYGGWLVVQGQMGVGTLVAFNAYIAFVFPPIVRFVDLATIFQRANTGLENVFALLDTKPEVADLPDATALPAIRGDVEFRRVSFDYDPAFTLPRGPRTLRDVSFKVEAGQIAAIVGPSGSGKSTIINLLARFYDPVSGEVMVDGRDIRHATADSFRQQIGIVLQENVLFSGTLEDNLKYGKPDATREEIIAASKTANAHDFIVALPDGYSTVVGERGAQMSGGQRQRIAIARAILKDPRILIFDEATSALDLVSERLIQEAMERVMKGRTTFIIAHRLSTIQLADQILVMDEGKLAEHGTHAGLLELGGLYARLHALQFKEAE